MSTGEEITQPKIPMTDEERLKLAAKLDSELDEFISGLEKRKYTEGWPEDKWEEEMEKHPFFMKSAPKPGEKLSPLMEGLQKLKYDPDENTPEELANAYREDGNFNFKHKNYRLAIIAYTEGIKVKCANSEVLASLHNNRAAANYYLKNYRSSLRDSELAMKYKPNYDKAIVRAATCALEISEYDKCVELCDDILINNSDNKSIIELRQKAIVAQKAHEKDVRKRKKQEDKRKSEDHKVLSAIKKRGISLDHVKGSSMNIDELIPKIPELADHRVSLHDGLLTWPVVIMYPEYRIMDFIQQFGETTSLEYHLSELFMETPNWDDENKYQIANVAVYFESKKDKKVLCKLNIAKTLGQILAEDRYVVRGGVPTFLVVIKGSETEKRLLKK